MNKRPLSKCEIVPANNPQSKEEIENALVDRLIAKAKRLDKQCKTDKHYYNALCAVLFVDTRPLSKKEIAYVKKMAKELGLVK